MSDARIAGLIQARMGSTRLPGKMMRDLCGKPMVGHIIDRLQAVPGLCGIVLATTTDPRNDEMIAYARARGLSVYRAEGEDDIAERLLGAAQLMRADAILKINGDCPLADPAVLARMVETWRASGDAQYVSNKIVWTYPEGLSAEVIATPALEWCDANLSDATDRELVANWIKNHPDRFKQQSVESGRDLGKLRWTVDTREDFAEVEAIVAKLGGGSRNFGLDEILSAMDDRVNDPVGPKPPAVLDISRMKVTAGGVKDFVWPVAREEVFAVRDAFLARIVPFLRHHETASRQTALVALLSALLGEVLSLYRAQAVVRRLGDAAEFSPASRLYPALAAGRVPDFSGVVRLLERGAPPPPAWRRAGRILRPRFAPNILAAPPARPNLATDVVTIAVGHMINQHAAALDEPVYFRRFEAWFAPLRSGDGTAHGGPPRPALLDELIDIVRAAFAAGGEAVPDPVVRYLRDWTTRAAGVADRYLARMLARPRTVPRRLWRATGGHPFGQILSRACRELGGQVTGHDHSHGQGAWQSHSDSVVELPGCDRFVVWTEMQRAMALRNLRPDLMVDASPPVFDVVPGTFRSPVAVSPPSSRPDGAPRRVMVVGTLYGDDFVSFTPLDPIPVLVDFEARLIGRLSDWGYEVLFKPHPESSFAPPAAYADQLGARIMGGRFEDCYREADVILFGQPNCTSFFNVLATSMPIVIADTGLHRWHPEALGLLEGRVGITIGERETDNRIGMDWDAVRESIRRAPSLGDDRFYDVFMRGRAPDRTATAIQRELSST